MGKTGSTIGAKNVAKVGDTKGRLYFKQPRSSLASLVFHPRLRVAGRR